MKMTIATNGIRTFITIVCQVRILGACQKLLLNSLSQKYLHIGSAAKSSLFGGNKTPEDGNVSRVYACILRVRVAYRALRTYVISAGFKLGGTNTFRQVRSNLMRLLPQKSCILYGDIIPNTA